MHLLLDMAEGAGHAARTLGSSFLLKGGGHPFLLLYLYLSCK